jgi:flagellar basal body-associated protein FliL
MPAKIDRDNLIAYTLLATTFVLIAGFAIASAHQKRLVKAQMEPVFLKPFPVVTATRKHSIAATFTVRTRQSDEQWAKSNKAAMEEILKGVLISADLDGGLAPDSLRKLQESLRDTLNTTLQTTKVQEVLITDFLLGDTSQ